MVVQDSIYKEARSRWTYQQDTRDLVLLSRGLPCWSIRSGWGRVLKTSFTRIRVDPCVTWVCYFERLQRLDGLVPREDALVRGFPEVRETVSGILQRLDEVNRLLGNDRGVVVTLNSAWGNRKEVSEET